MFGKLLKNLFEPTAEIIPEIKVEIAMDKPTDAELKIYVLRRQATQHKQSNEIDKALAYLDESFKLTKELGFVPSLDEQLRYANYLQLAGRNDTAWSEYNRILPLFSTDHDALGIIYDKMRLFLQRENKLQLAVKFGALAYLYNASTFSQRMKANNFDLGETPRSRYEHIFSDNGIREYCKSLLKKAKRTDLMEAFADIIRTHLDNLPKINAKQITSQVEGLFAKQ